jgi:hypothetical protein
VSAQYSVKNVIGERTIYVRMHGRFDEEAMRKFAQEYKSATDTYRGGPHLVMADMRGMAPASPQAAELFGESIGYARRRGVVCCAHLSDSTVQRLQARRVAREHSPGDDVTVDVVSEDEGRKLLAERRATLTKASTTHKP